MADNLRKLALAQAAAHCAAEACAELLRYAREGKYDDADFHPDAEPLEKLCDAARMVAEIVEDDPDRNGDRNQLRGALEKFSGGVGVMKNPFSRITGLPTETVERVEDKARALAFRRVNP